MMTARDAMNMTSLDEKSRDDLARKHFEDAANAKIREAAYRGKTSVNVKIAGIGEDEGLGYFENLGYKVSTSRMIGTFDSYDVFCVKWDHLKS